MKINWKQAKKLKEEFQNKERERATLGTLFAIFDLTKKEDLKTIERVTILRYSTNTVAGPKPGLYKLYVDYEDFCEIWEYAREKEEMLTEFHQNYVENYLKKYYELMENNHA